MRLSTAARRSTVATSGGSPNSSPQAARTAGATWMRVIFSGLAMASKTRSVSSRSRSAPTGQWVMHWPQRAQSVSAMGRMPATFTAEWLERLTRSHTPVACILSHTWMQRMHLMHLSLSRMRGKLRSHSSCGRRFS